MEDEKMIPVTGGWSRRDEKSRRASGFARVESESSREGPSGRGGRRMGQADVSGGMDGRGIRHAPSSSEKEGSRMGGE